MRNPAESQDEDDEGPIWDEVRLTRYDRALAARRKHEAKRDAILAHPVQSDANARKLLALEHLIERAMKAMKMAEGDLARRQEGIDDWRKTPEGRDKRNTSRRKVRPQGNAVLSDLSPDQKAQHEKDMTSDRGWRSRCRKAGWPEARIQAELVVRIRDRHAKRAARGQVDAEEAAMKSHRTYGMV